MKVIHYLGGIVVQKLSTNFGFASASLWQGLKKYPFFVNNNNNSKNSNDKNKNRLY